MTLALTAGVGGAALNDLAAVLSVVAVVLLISGYDLWRRSRQSHVDATPAAQAFHQALLTRIGDLERRLELTNRELHVLQFQHDRLARDFVASTRPRAR